MRSFFLLGLHYFYPRSPCGERRKMQVFIQGLGCISIHALLAESDAIFGVRGSAICNFYPRSPCGERPRKKLLQYAHDQFLSTLSLRRATRKKLLQYAHDQFLSTLSLRRATGGHRGVRGGRRKFLSTLSLRRATQIAPAAPRERAISIHALLAESDHIHAPNRRPYHYFYPRSPCGERPIMDNVILVPG